MQKILQYAGLTDVESKVYLVLLDLGSALAGSISRKSGVHRRSVYDVMERLIQKGLVSYITKNNRRYYEAADPKRLLEIVHDKLQEVQNLLPELELKYNMSKEKQETVFFKGKEGIRSIFEDQINEQKEVLIIGGAKNATEILKYYLNRYTKRRVERKIKMKIIYAGREKHSKIPLTSIRYLPKSYESQAATNIWGDRVAIILWSTTPIAILIKQKEIADGYRKQFDLLWDIAQA